jgi:hypothetical protein
MSCDRERTMRKSLFVLASTGSLATMNAAIAQYVPGYYAPGYYAPGYYAPGYTWRDRRERPTNDWLLWQNYEKQRNNTIGSGSIDLTNPGSIGLTNPNAVGGECAKGFSEETCRRRGEKYNPPHQN